MLSIGKTSCGMLYKHISFNHNLVNWVLQLSLLFDQVAALE
jgi:hypothetical protein